jgi:serine/threonine protein kinase/ABC-type branched-subunit amino acid transport system substrate-binding protein
MGAALLATDIRLDNKAVVIKELISDNVDQTKLQEDVRNFKREVATLAHIDHPLVPNVTDHFQEGQHYFMVQEYIEGENLEEQIERIRQPLKEREVLICASQILDILAYLSQQTPPLVHRDIKPANIIIGSRDKRAHLVDFGIARAEVARNAQRKQTSALGTPGYAPPEQYQGNADPRSDLYALAATMHHLLTNRDPRDHPPFNYPPVCTFNPQLSPETEQVLILALNNDRNQRYQSAVAMKQDIDNILRQRYAVSGNIDSYTLGTSTNFGTVSASQDLTMLSSTNLPTFVNGPTPIPVPVTSPVSQSQLDLPLFSQGPNTPQSLGSGSMSLPPQRRRRTGLIIGSLLLILLLLSGGGCIAFLRSHTLLAPGIGVTEIGKEPIGISDGSFAFDTTLADGSLKSQAAQMYRQNSGNISPVTSLLNQAIAMNSNDAEALIYQEDLKVVNSGRPYVTIVVATMLSGGNVSVGRDDLQGAYVAQKEFNDGSKLNGGVQVRLLIANTGSDAAYVSNITRQIEQLSQADKTFVGVMGWPFSSYTLSAIKELSSAHIPLVSQTASSDELTNASPYFFRVVPSNNQQGIQGAKYAINTLNAKKVALFYDQQDSYSQSLAQDFQVEFQKEGGQVVAEEMYTVGQPGTLPEKLQDALKKKPDLIYFSGYASDVSTLLSNMSPQSSLPVLGGDALYELGGYSSSARASGFTHLHFTAFAYPDEWDVLGDSSQEPVFFSEYPVDFDPNSLHQGSPYGFTRADNDVMLSYDAMVTLLSGCNIALSSGKQSITPEDLQQALSKLNGANAIQGVSGQIALGSDGNPIDKAIVLLYVDDKGFIHMDSNILGQFLK